jgi:hypothetical protein
MEHFGGDKKVGHSLLTGAETRLKNWAIPKIAPEIETYHLTLTTLLWSFIIWKHDMQVKMMLKEKEEA